MRTILIAAAGIAALGGIIVLLFIEAGPVRFSVLPEIPSAAVLLKPPHVLGNEKESLGRVQLSVVYVVPRDRQELIRQDWASAIERPLEEMRAFHRLQFHGKSDLTYEVLPEPVIGEQDASVYDGADTNRGNPHAWEALRRELNRRFEELEAKEGVFPVRLVLYEGVGALGGDHQILVSSGFLRTGYAASVFYHELGHTFGLEDAYDYASGASSDEDVMGLGRQKPIGQAYLSDEAKRKLGIIW